MRIHGIVWIIVGVFLVGFSYFISGSGVDIQKFSLFIWTGAVFIVIGFVKAVIWIKSKPAKAKTHKENYPHHRAKLNKEDNPVNQMHGQTNEFIKFCSSCGNAVRHFDRFCYKCGSRVFHKK